MNLGHLLFVSLLNTLYRQRLRDPFTMYKVFRRDCLHGLRFECNRFDFDFERMNELEVYFRGDPKTARGFRRIVVTEPEHPYIPAWWPPGHGIGYEHLFIHIVYEFMDALDRGVLPTPNVYDGLAGMRVIEAVESSAQLREWVRV